MLSLVAVTAATAQVNRSMVSVNQSRNDNYAVAKKDNSFQTKAQGDVLWSNNFTTPADWTMGNNGGGATPPHTAGDWAIVNALPSGLPFTTFNSTSLGNYALINSDAAGNTASQNAFIRTANDIALADLLNTNGDAPNQAVYLRFNELFRHFQEENFVQVSNDGGATWTTIQVNPESEVPVNSNSTNPEVELVNLTSVLGGVANWSNNVRIGFLYQGAWDWFWAIDDVELIVGYDFDAKITQTYQATDITTTSGYDYYRVPVSQTNFPGLTFGAKVYNNGGATLSTTSLNVSGGSYNQSSAPSSIISGATDSLAITTPFMIPATAGSTVLTLTSNIGAETDAVPGNNVSTMTIVRDPLVYARDNDVITGGISQVTSQNDVELSIGNVMEVFNDMVVESIQIRLMNQTDAVGQEIEGRIELYNPTTEEFDYLANTGMYMITSTDLNTFVTIPIQGGPVTIDAGSEILVLAKHFGGANEVAFGMAQGTTEGSVFGYTADQNIFRLLSPGAVMIRLKEAAPASISENNASAQVNIYPNPVANGATVEINGANATNVSVMDLTGKVVYSTPVSEGASKVTFNTTNFAAGVYTVNVATEAGIVTKKMVVKN